MACLACPACPVFVTSTITHNRKCAFTKQRYSLAHLSPGQWNSPSTTVVIFAFSFLLSFFSLFFFISPSTPHFHTTPYLRSCLLSLPTLCTHTHTLNSTSHLSLRPFLVHTHTLTTNKQQTKTQRTNTFPSSPKQYRKTPA